MRHCNGINITVLLSFLCVCVLRLTDWKLSCIMHHEQIPHIVFPFPCYSALYLSVPCPFYYSILVSRLSCNWWFNLLHTRLCFKLKRNFAWDVLSMCVNYKLFFRISVLWTCWQYLLVPAEVWTDSLAGSVRLPCIYSVIVGVHRKHDNKQVSAENCRIHFPY